MLFKKILVRPFLWSEIVHMLPLKNYFGVLFLLLSALFALLFFNQSLFIQKSSSIYLYRTGILLNKIDSIEAKNKVIQGEIFLLNEEVTKAVEKSQKTEMAKLSKYIGSREYSKNGVQIIIKDNSEPVENEDDSNEGIVHNTDLLKITNLLWNLGAQAVSINNQRVINATEIVCTGPTITINGVIVNSPFEIKAGGNLKRLMQIEQEGYIDFLRSRGIEFSIKRMDNVSIPVWDKNKYKGEE